VTGSGSACGLNERGENRLKDDDIKQNVARMVLKDIKVESGVLKLYLGLPGGG
jgi:hypothetical protein